MRNTESIVRSGGDLNDLDLAASADWLETHAGAICGLPKIIACASEATCPQVARGISALA